MTTFDITSLSSKGQIVIPSNLRKELKIAPGVKLIIFTDGSNLLLKPVKPPQIENFKMLIRESRALIKKQQIKKSDVKNLIKQLRNENRS